MDGSLSFGQGHPSCSNCSGRHKLHVVTCAGPGADEPGRILVYCSSCRTDHQHMLDVSMPIELLSRTALVGLYRCGKTVSDPKIMAETILGLDDPALVDELELILESRDVA
jgi:hypothetical protein